MLCNCCWVALDSEDNIGLKHVATPCMHLYCLGCAQKLLAGDSCCNVCQAPFSQNDVKVVQLLQSSNRHNLSLCGQTPDVIMQSALTAIQFYVTQSQLAGQYRENKLEKRMQALHNQCNEKLAQVHQAYTKAKQKAAMLGNQANELRQERDELAAKYQQRSSQYKQLKEQMKQAQMQPQLMGMPIQGTFLQGNNGNSGRGTMASSPNGIGHMITTVQQRTAVFNMPDNSAATPPMQLLPLAGGGAAAGTKRRQSSGNMQLLGGSADMSPSLGMHSGGRQRRVSENMVLGGMNKLGGSGGHLMNMGNVLQTSNRHNTFAGSPHGFTTSM